MKIGLLFFSAIIFAACAPDSLLPTSSPINTGVSPPTRAPTTTSIIAPTEERVPFNTSDWKTNFGKRIVSFGEIISGGPPKDGIPALDDPKFISVADAGKWISDNEPVVLFQNNNDARAYPLQILIWHEIVNDTVGGKPIAITFCPLCNTSIVFNRVIAGQATTFGTTGKLRYSDLVMYDRASETWWQQATGEALIGERVGMTLTMLPSQVISFADFKTRFANGKVLSQDTGYARSYGANPYAAYDNAGNFPFLYRGPDTPKTLQMTDYVVTILIEKIAKAYPYRALAQKRVINDSVANQDLVVIWKGGMSSALDAAAISKGRDIGATGVFSRRVENRALTFAMEGERIKDQETNSTWNVLGEAIDGALKGTQLAPIVHGNHFWFAWFAFRPDTQVYEAK